MASIDEYQQRRFFNNEEYFDKEKLIRVLKLPIEIECSEIEKVEFSDRTELVFIKNIKKIK